MHTATNRHHRTSLIARPIPVLCCNFSDIVPHTLDHSPQVFAGRSLLPESTEPLNMMLVQILDSVIGELLSLPFPPDNAYPFLLRRLRLHEHGWFAPLAQSVQSTA